MAVISYREVLPRTLTQKFGDSPTAEVKVIVTVDEPTPHQTIISTVGIVFGDQHPEFSYLRMLDANVTETDRHHVEISYRYELPSQQDFEPHPLARPDVWTFSVGGAQVPALRYYHGTGNSDIRPLTNAAFSYIEGLTTLEAEVRCTIAGNRAVFPAALAASVTNSINSSQYLFGDTHTWLCQGISASQQTEAVNGFPVNFWAVSAELTYRASGHLLRIPHVGFQCVDAGKLVPCVVYDKTDNAYIAATDPQPLTSTGAQKNFPGPTPEQPDILTRRVYPEINFASFFGTPPF